MANLIDVVNAMFKKDGWSDITSDDKEEFFFIINRFLSKKYPQLSQLLNDKSIDKVSAMDTWYFFLQKENYPKWFWSKSNISKDKSGISEKEIIYLLNELDIKREDLNILIKYYPSIIKEEVKYYTDAQKPK
jgi:hypothetical protein